MIHSHDSLRSPVVGILAAFTGTRKLAIAGYLDISVMSVYIALEEDSHDLLP